MYLSLQCELQHFVIFNSVDLFINFVTFNNDHFMIVIVVAHLNSRISNLISSTNPFLHRLSLCFWTNLSPHWTPIHNNQLKATPFALVHQQSPLLFPITQLFPPFILSLLPTLELFPLVLPRRTRNQLKEAHVTEEPVKQTPTVKDDELTSLSI